MIIYLMGERNAFSEDFPMTAFEIEDALDRFGGDLENTNIRFIISKSENNNLPSEMCEEEFSGDIYKLNLLVDRLENLENALCGYIAQTIKNPAQKKAVPVILDFVFF